jgi:hypothetical protein
MHLGYYLFGWRWKNTKIYFKQDMNIPSYINDFIAFKFLYFEWYKLYKKEKTITKKINKPKQQ